MGADKVTMKVFVCLFALIAAAVAENCDHDNDCQLTVCGTGFHVDCYRDNVCTCLPDSYSTYRCNAPSECTSRFGECRYNDHKWHCVDNICRCRTYNNNND